MWGLVDLPREKHMSEVINSESEQDESGRRAKLNEPTKTHNKEVERFSEILMAGGLIPHSQRH